MQFIGLGKKWVIPIKLSVQNKNAISLLDSALDCWPYNGAKQCDKDLARYFITVIMSPKITQGCASAVCLYPISREFICWLQGPRIKERIWRCTSCGTPLMGVLAFLLSLKLLCSCCWAVAYGGTGVNIHSLCVLQELTLPSRTWDSPEHRRPSERWRGSLTNSWSNSRVWLVKLGKYRWKKA